jgi:hypothetical protein
MSVPARAAGEAQAVPQAVNDGLSHLLGLVGPGAGGGLDPQRVAPVIDFVAAGKASAASYQAEQIDGVASAYHEFTLQRDLSSLIALIYNPEIPPQLFFPSSVRLAFWRQVEHPDRRLPRLWESLPRLSEPVIVRGVEHEVITPDLNSGAYYAYDLHRTLILVRHGSRHVLVSLTRQAGTSEVGRKGMVLGADENWDYLYSGIEGLTRPGLGWASTYMYDSFGVSIYLEPEPGRAPVRCGVFKWVRAGWSGLNVVKNHHIRNGLERYAQGFASVVGDPRLPGADDLERLCSRIAGRSTDELRREAGAYLAELALRYPQLSEIQRDWCGGCLDGDGYLASLGRPELQAMVTLEQVKRLLARKPSGAGSQALVSLREGSLHGATP